MHKLFFLLNNNGPMWGKMAFLKRKETVDSTTMDFDLFYELSVPQYAGRTESEVFHNALDELALADRLGFNIAWLVEHHFMPGYSHSSAPELFLAAASQRTKNLRLGFGIIPLPYTHPIRAAERIATLDVLSKGRVEFGFGRGFSPKEYACFGAEMKQSRTVTQEAYEVIKQSFTGQPVNFQGEHFQFESLDVLPKLIQQPHPPLWTAAVSPESYEMAAQMGVGVLAGPFKPWFMIKEDIKRFRKAWAKEQDTASNPNLNSKVGMTIGIFCLEDGKQARALAKEGMVWFYKKLLEQTLPVLQQLYEGYEYYRKVGHISSLAGKAINLTILEALGMVIVGDPEHCRKKLAAFEKAGVDNVLCAIGAGVLPTELTQQSMKILAEQVIPHFKNP